MHFQLNPHSSFINHHSSFIGYIASVPILPLYGHATLRRRLEKSVSRNSLPASLLIEGPRGIGKQRLALWLGKLLVCTDRGTEPCGRCQSCRYCDELSHPDLRWFFPRPRIEANPSAQDILDDYCDALAERRGAGGLYAAPGGAEGIFVATIHALVGLSALTPSLGKRKVFVVGDADRMIPQEGSDFSANAFLKLLEEPPLDTTIILTSSCPGALLPTIRSRVVSVRASLLPESDVREFLADPVVQTALAEAEVAPSLEDRVQLAGGAPGALFSHAGRVQADEAASALLQAVTSGRAQQMSTVLSLGSSRARGSFSDTLDAVSTRLAKRARESAQRSDMKDTLACSRAIDAIETAKLRADGNANPQLVGAALMREMSELFA